MVIVMVVTVISKVAAVVVSDVVFFLPSLSFQIKTRNSE